MASMQDGPVGVSYEVPGADEQSAIENSWRAAEAQGRELGRTLHVEQLEAGKWEVVMEDNGPAGSGIPGPGGVPTPRTRSVALLRRLAAGSPDKSHLRGVEEEAASILQAMAVPLTPAEAEAFRAYVKDLDRQAAEMLGVPFIDQDRQADDNTKS